MSFRNGLSFYHRLPTRHINFPQVKGGPEVGMMTMQGHCLTLTDVGYIRIE